EPLSAVDAQAVNLPLRQAGARSLPSAAGEVEQTVARADPHCAVGIFQQPRDESFCNPVPRSPIADLAVAQSADAATVAEPKPHAAVPRREKRTHRCIRQRPSPDRVPSNEASTVEPDRTSIGA